MSAKFSAGASQFPNYASASALFFAVLLYLFTRNSPQDTQSCKAGQWTETGCQFLPCHWILEWLQQRHLHSFSPDYISLKKKGGGAGWGGGQIAILLLVLLLQRAVARIKIDLAFSLWQCKTLYKNQVTLQKYTKTMSTTRQNWPKCWTLISRALSKMEWIENISPFCT